MPFHEIVCVGCVVSTCILGQVVLCFHDFVRDSILIPVAYASLSMALVGYFKMHSTILIVGYATTKALEASALAIIIEHDDLGEIEVSVLFIVTIFCGLVSFVFLGCGSGIFLPAAERWGEKVWLSRISMLLTLEIFTIFIAEVICSTMPADCALVPLVAKALVFTCVYFTFEREPRSHTE